jgi:hypothetical protein
VEKTVRKPIAFSQNGEEESAAKKKRGRKSKTEPNDESLTTTVRFLSFDRKQKSFFFLDSNNIGKTCSKKKFIFDKRSNTIET